METKEIYEDLTTVNIDEQKDVWNERGKGYYGEYLVFSTLLGYLKDNSKILMNLEIPTANNKKTEIDMLLIHETGLYCFEMKYYKGDIYCNFGQDRWVQAFRTVKNNAFYSPIEQNKYHIRALKQLFPQAPIYSYILFTNDDVTLHEGRGNAGIFTNKALDNATVCTLYWFDRNIDRILSSNQVIYSTEEINDIFIELSQYTNNQQKINIGGNRVMSFEEYVNCFHVAYNLKTKEINEEANLRIKKSSTLRNIAYLIAVIGIAVAILGTIIIPAARIKMIEDKYDEFFAIFERVDDKTVLDGLSMDDIARCKSISINPVNNNNNIVNITFTIEGLSNDYGISLTKESRLIVTLKDGSVKEVDIFSDNFVSDMILRGNAELNRAYIEHSFSVKSVDIPNVNKDDIVYIKLNNICLYKSSFSNAVKNNVEIELYVK